MVNICKIARVCARDRAVNSHFVKKDTFYFVQNAKNEKKHNFVIDKNA